MRTLNITLNNDNTVTVGNTFTGYVEENNATMLQIELNSELSDSSIDYHVVNFRHGENDEKLVSGKIEEYIEGLSDETDAYRVDDCIYIKLPQYVTGYTDIFAQVEGHHTDYDVNTHSTFISEIIKSPVFHFTLEPSIVGNQGEFNTKVEGIFAKLAPYESSIPLLQEQVAAISSATISDVENYNLLPDTADELTVKRVKNATEYVDYEPVFLTNDFFDAEEFRLVKNPPQPTLDDFEVGYYSSASLGASVNTGTKSYYFSIMPGEGMPKDPFFRQMCYYFECYEDDTIYAYLYSDFTIDGTTVDAGWVKLSGVSRHEGIIQSYTGIENVQYEDIEFPKNCSVLFMNTTISANKNTTVYRVKKTKEHLPGYYVYKSGKWDTSESPTMLSQLQEDENHRTVTNKEKMRISNMYLQTQSLQTQIDNKPDTSDIPTSLSELSEDSEHRLTTDTEKAGWNAKAEVEDIPTKTSELQNDSGYITETGAIGIKTDIDGQDGFAKLKIVNGNPILNITVQDEEEEI